MKTPKLSSLTPTDKIRLAAELDGLYFGTSDHDQEQAWRTIATGAYVRKSISDYDTSYDAIIPCLMRQGLWTKVMSKFQSEPPTPAQILDELLIESGKCER